MPRKILHISQNVEEDKPCFIGRGEGFGVSSRPHFAKCGGEFTPTIMKSGCGEGAKGLDGAGKCVRRVEINR